MGGGPTNRHQECGLNNTKNGEAALYGNPLPLCNQPGKQAQLA